MNEITGKSATFLMNQENETKTSDGFVHYHNYTLILYE